MWIIYYLNMFVFICLPFEIFILFLTLKILWLTWSTLGKHYWMENSFLSITTGCRISLPQWLWYVYVYNTTFINLQNIRLLMGAEKIDCWNILRLSSIKYISLSLSSSMVTSPRAWSSHAKLATCRIWGMKQWKFYVTSIVHIRGV